LIGKRSTQVTLFDVGNVFAHAPDPKTFHGQLARISDELFRDEDFAALYKEGKGRPSTPPSLLALTLLMQTSEGLSDEAAIRHTACDLDWAAVLRRHAGTPLCAKSTLQLFRSHLILHEDFRTFLQRSIDQAKEAGLIQGRALTVALDTKPMLGRGAVQDTYNLLAQAMRQLARALAREQGVSIRLYLDQHDLADLAEPSIKGCALVDWSDENARHVFLTELVGHARKLLALVQEEPTAHVREQAQLLSQILLQDVDEKPAPGDPDLPDDPDHSDDPDLPQMSVKKQTVRDRVPSATDPQQRHGRKSASKRFNGHKSSIVCDISSGIILSCDILPGNASDATDAHEQVEQAQCNVGLPIAEALGDCAYGGAETRAEFADTKHTLIAKVPSPQSGPFSKSAFSIDLINDQVQCPAGHISTRFTRQKDGGKIFHFSAYCQGCPLREPCSKAKQGRTLQVHPNEAALQQARAFQNSLVGRQKLKQRLVVENALARLAGYGVGQARYLGHVKSRFQLTMASAVANLRRTWNSAVLEPTPAVV
jgi:hypothetical protein